MSDDSISADFLCRTKTHFDGVRNRQGTWLWVWRLPSGLVVDSPADTMEGSRRDALAIIEQLAGACTRGDGKLYGEEDERKDAGWVIGEDAVRIGPKGEGWEEFCEKD